MRVLISYPPFQGLNSNAFEWGTWPAKWVRHPDVRGGEAVVTGYRLVVHVSEWCVIRFHVTADERYQIYLDGKLLGRGSERGDLNNWFFESFDISLEPGRHVFAAKTWWLGPDTPSPFAQHSHRPAFLFAVEGPLGALFTTGSAHWETCVLNGYHFLNPDMAWGTGAKLALVGSEMNDLHDEFNDWKPAVPVGPAWAADFTYNAELPWRLRPATLPPQIDREIPAPIVRQVQKTESIETKDLVIRAGDNLANEASQWQALFDDNRPLTIAPFTSRRIIIDFNEYYCAFPTLVTSAGEGATVRIHWAEATFETYEYLPLETSPRKGSRDIIEGKKFHGCGDVFEPDGSNARSFTTLWWEAGRYVEIAIVTKDRALVIESLKFRETGYPYQFEGKFAASDERLMHVVPPALRTLQMCSHETYMDCPYYEQLQYIGDTRLQALVTYTHARDDRLIRKALRMFDASRLHNGLTQSRYPCRALQIIPPFSLYYISMLHDFSRWRNDRAFVRSLLPGVRAVMDYFASIVRDDDLVGTPAGWNFYDWVPHWWPGVPTEGQSGVSALVNFQVVMTLKHAAEVEEYAGEKEIAAIYRARAARIEIAAGEAFWDESRQLLADDTKKSSFSEHTQCFALLGDALDPHRREKAIEGLLNDPSLTRTTIYFTHYLFETYFLLSQGQRILDRMNLWFGNKALGLKTLVECPEPPRSDCHAWSAHPAYHFHASILGVRPAGTGFDRVVIKPQLGSLEFASGTTVHPLGLITTDFQSLSGGLRAIVELPQTLSGDLVFGDATHSLKPGRNEFMI